MAHETSFLPDVTTPCEACGGARFEGGAAGGKVVATGTPREIAARKTATGKVLRELFARAG